MPNSWALGLYSYSTPHPGTEGFSRFYDSVLTVFQAAGITPTYFAAEGVGYKGDLTKYGGRTHSKALKSRFADIHVMSLVANPEGSVEPGYDSFASASLGYVEETNETLLCLAMEERFTAFEGGAFEGILQALAALQPWDFGYALLQPAEKKPEFHVLGLDDGKLNKEEQRRLNAWYASVPGQRLRKLRDVYPYMLINDKQLGEKIAFPQSLDDVARSDAHSVLTRCDGSSLWLWKVQSEAIDSLREKLAACGALIT